jgi:hypothetical protein
MQTSGQLIGPRQRGVYPGVAGPLCPAHCRLRDADSNYTALNYSMAAEK